MRDAHDRNYRLTASHGATAHPDSSERTARRGLLRSKQLAALDYMYIYVGPTKTGEHMYGVKKPAPAPSSSKPDASPAKKSGAKAVSGSKRKVDQVIKPEPEPVAPESKSDDEPDMEWACKISVMRLLKKVKRENMIPLCKDFGVPSKGSIEQIAEILATQLHTTRRTKTRAL